MLTTKGISYTKTSITGELWHIDNYFKKINELLRSYESMYAEQPAQCFFFIFLTVATISYMHFYG